jgi:hypothetical protein
MASPSAILYAAFLIFTSGADLHGSGGCGMGVSDRHAQLANNLVDFGA